MRGVVCYYLLCCLSLIVCARCGLLLFVVVLFIADRSCEVWVGAGGKRDHLLYCQSQLQSVESVSDPKLLL